MRLIGLCAMCLCLAACTTTPIFPPEILKDVELRRSISRPGKAKPISPPLPPLCLTKWSWAGRSSTRFGTQTGSSFWPKNRPSKNMPAIARSVSNGHITPHSRSSSLALSRPVCCTLAMNLRWSERRTDPAPRRSTTFRKCCRTSMRNVFTSGKLRERICPILCGKAPWNICPQNTKYSALTTVRGSHCPPVAVTVIRERALQGCEGK